MPSSPAAVTTISFDIAGLEVYLPLSVGARIELASAEAASDGAALSRLIAESEATAGAVGPAAAPAALAAAGIAVPGQLNASNGAAAPPLPGEASPGSGQERDQDSDQH